MNGAVAVSDGPDCQPRRQEMITSVSKTEIAGEDGIGDERVEGFVRK